VRIGDLTRLGPIAAATGVTARRNELVTQHLVVELQRERQAVHDVDAIDTLAGRNVAARARAAARDLDHIGSQLGPVAATQVAAGVTGAVEDHARTTDRNRLRRILQPVQVVDVALAPGLPVNQRDDAVAVIVSGRQPGRITSLRAERHVQHVQVGRINDHVAVQVAPPLAAGVA
jgi:hypothetical protein